VAVTEAAPAVAAAAQRKDPQKTVRPVRARRSRIYLAGAVTLIVAGGVGSAFIYTMASHTEQMLVVSHDLQRGEVIAATDLGSIGVGQGQANQGVPVNDSADVVGKMAAVDLPKGSLITGRSFAGSLAVPEGQALVGLSLKPSQLPARPLIAGDQVVIVPVAAAGIPTPSSADSVNGVVSDTADDTASGSTIVDVYVSQTIAADLTSRAAAGAVAIYLTPSGE
jgi:flagella basal body P-ring formation protein FlgA